MPRFRSQFPKQSCIKTFKDYRRYKKFLVDDFSHRCGYCDDEDTWHGGFKNFQIDHFAPKERFPTLLTTYSNLIYSCPSCNRSKWDKWPSKFSHKNIVRNKGFLNPIFDDFNKHFKRANSGAIIPLSLVANDMMISLSLDLERHSVLWKLSNLDKKIKKFELGLKAKSFKNNAKAVQAHYLLLKIFKSYQEKLKILNEK